MGRGKLLICNNKYVFVKDKSPTQGNKFPEYNKCITCSKGNEVRIKVISEKCAEYTQSSKLTHGHLSDEPKIKSIRASNAMIKEALRNRLKKRSTIFNENRLESFFK